MSSECRICSKALKVRKYMRCCGPSCRKKYRAWRDQKNREKAEEQKPRVHHFRGASKAIYFPYAQAPKHVPEPPQVRNSHPVIKLRKNPKNL